MSNAKFISQLDTIVAFADELKIKAERLRKELVGVDQSASPKGVRKKIVPDSTMAKILSRQRKAISKNNNN